MLLIRIDKDFSKGFCIAFNGIYYPISVFHYFDFCCLLLVFLHSHITQYTLLALSAERLLPINYHSYY